MHTHGSNQLGKRRQQRAALDRSHLPSATSAHVAITHKGSSSSGHAAARTSVRCAAGSRERLLDAFWQARGVMDAEQRSRLVRVACDVPELAVTPLSSTQPLPGIPATWTLDQYATEAEVLEVSRRLLQLQELLGGSSGNHRSSSSSSGSAFWSSGASVGAGGSSGGAGADVSWMVVREPRLLTADFGQLMLRLIDMKALTAGTGIDVVKVVERQPALLLSESWLSDFEQEQQQQQQQQGQGKQGTGQQQGQEQGQQPGQEQGQGVGQGQGQHGNGQQDGQGQGVQRQALAKVQKVSLQRRLLPGQESLESGFSNLGFQGYQLQYTGHSDLGGLSDWGAGSDLEGYGGGYAAYAGDVGYGVGNGAGIASGESDAGLSGAGQGAQGGVRVADQGQQLPHESGSLWDGMHPPGERLGGVDAVAGLGRDREEREEVGESGQEEERGGGWVSADEVERFLLGAGGNGTEGERDAATAAAAARVGAAATGGAAAGAAAQSAVGSGTGASGRVGNAEGAPPLVATAWPEPSPSSVSASSTATAVGAPTTAASNPTAGSPTAGSAPTSSGGALTAGGSNPAAGPRTALQEVVHAWEFGLPSDGAAEWEERYSQLQQYRQRCGDPHCGYRDGDDLELTRWANKQRSDLRRGQLTEDRRSRLEQLGFAFEEDEAEFQRWLAELRNFKLVSGHCNPSPLATGVDLYLYHWCAVQRIAARSRVLSQHRTQQLTDLGFDWTGADPLS